MLDANELSDRFSEDWIPYNEQENDWHI
jgi:hypothetical protein